MITVLVVDDDFRVARIHSAFVDRVEGFRTIGVASNGAEALEMARRLVPDLILLDLYLPDVFGLDLLNQMRVAGVEGDVIVISAANESETVERALKLGVANYLLKPFTLDDLASRLSEYRSQHQRRLRPLVGDQAEIDRIFGRSEPTIAESLPKGMSLETAELILATLRERSEEQSAQQCGAAAGISRVSARRYLEFFVSQGKAQVSLRYGSRGRPERLYRLAVGSDTNQRS
jgi:response regulator of citrate/malate metabolism